MASIVKPSTIVPGFTPLPLNTRIALLMLAFALCRVVDAAAFAPGSVHGPLPVQPYPPTRRVGVVTDRLTLL